jgi:LmbE family N-acetylglucosaminyl deacetylase
MLSEINKALVIAPHQDDETIGCGGAICYLKEQGYDIDVAHVYLGTSGVSGLNPEESSNLRHREALAAAKIGGYNVLPNLGFTDRDRSQDFELASAIIKLMRASRPDVVFLPHRGETDYEHQLVSTAGREASWLSGSDNISPELGEPLKRLPQVFYYEVWKPLDSPTVTMDITPYEEQKKSMLRAFESQMKNTSWVKGCMGLSAYRGTICLGDGSCEVFETEKLDMKRIL